MVVFVQITSVGGALIGTSNVAATNGLIHLIDKVKRNTTKTTPSKFFCTHYRFQPLFFFFLIKVLVPDRTLSEGLLATLALRPEFSLFRSYLIVRPLKHAHTMLKCSMFPYMLCFLWLFV